MDYCPLIKFLIKHPLREGFAGYSKFCFVGPSASGVFL